MFTKEDLSQISLKGLTVQQIERQIEHFKLGFPPIRLIRPATAGDGIMCFSEEEKNHFLKHFEAGLPFSKVLKFVPASGAASRMFKHLFEFRDKYVPDGSGYARFIKEQGFNSIYHLITHLRETAFFEDLEKVAEKAGTDIETLLNQRDYGKVIDLILQPEGLGYAQLPKALLKFHRYPEGARTAAEEHLAEAARYTADHDRTARIHFTISPEHREKFNHLLERVVDPLETRYNVHFDIGFSVQKPSTDVIAVDELNRPVRNTDGSLLFRPGGHGALLENLNEMDADYIFIKNIDNVVPEHLRGETYHYKKVLGGYLMSLKETLDGYLLKMSEHHDEAGIADPEEVIAFAKERLLLDIPDDLRNYSRSLQVEALIRLLNRPVRVCGMVKNEGEPGGGPFWVMDGDGKTSLQIVESSQIDFNDPDQKSIADRATHFNPVDLVCCVRDYRGRQFDLKEYVDDNTGFISLKSSGGTTLKAQELPGLWNGAMAKWITLFVEVPILTFNPVKTVNDLLRKEHLPANQAT